MNIHPATAHYYKTFRRERPDIPALQTWRDASRHAHFRDTLAADVKAHTKRSKAAKKAWKARKAKEAK